MLQESLKMKKGLKIFLLEHIKFLPKNSPKVKNNKKVNGKISK